MNDPPPATAVADVARACFDVLGTGRQIAPFTARASGLDLAGAYRVTAAVRQLRESRGERVIGRKIGFTNRTIWDEYGVHAPIWGYLYDRTVRDLAAVADGVPLAGLAEPRIEPEIVVGFGTAPEAGMDERAILDCIDWVAHGFEIVQSIFPDWRFAAADTVAAYGLHGALLIGPRQPVAPARDGWLRALSRFEVALARDGETVDRGLAHNVLDGPLSALRHLVDLLAGDPSNPPLGAGEIVTTGTLTRAFPVAAGQGWSTHLSGIDLDGIQIRFV